MCKGYQIQWFTGAGMIMKGRIGIIQWCEDNQSK